MFLQAGRAGSDRQTARGSSWKANLSSLNCSRRSNVAGEAKNLKVKSTRARLKDHFCVCRRSLEMRSVRKPPALGPSSTAAAPGFQDQGGAEFISLRPAKLPEKCQRRFYGQKYAHGQSVWWRSVAQYHLKILLKWTVVQYALAILWLSQYLESRWSSYTDVLRSQNSLHVIYYYDVKCYVKTVKYYNIITVAL